MTTKIKKIPPLVMLYVLTAIIYFVSSLFYIVTDTFTIGEETSPSLSDFELYDVEIVSDNMLIATGADPQIILKSDDVRSVYYSLTGSTSGVVCAYYLTDESEDFSNHKRLFPDFGKTAEAFYVFPYDTKVIRIDFGSEVGETYEFEELTLNKKIPLLEYFTPTNRKLIIFASAPLILYSILSLFVIKKRNENEK